jgi:hypothetical protein
MIAFQTIDWSTVKKDIYKGDTGEAIWQTVQYDGLRIRLVEYSENYIADHWCKKGHIVHCMEGTFISEMKTGESFTLHAGMSYVVSDNAGTHKSVSATGVKLLIVDGDFLKN